MGNAEENGVVAGRHNEPAGCGRCPENREPPVESVNRGPLFVLAGPFDADMESGLVLVTNGRETVHGRLELRRDRMNDQSQMRSDVIRRLLHGSEIASPMPAEKSTKNT